MSYPLPIQSKRRSADERVFADARNRLWSAVFTRPAGEWAIVFACITDARTPIRALALTDEGRRRELTETTLREWLVSAPRLGPLT